MTILGPTWVYHRTEPPRLVETQAQYDALGPGWAESPAVFYVDSPVPAPPVVSSRPRRRAQETATDA